MRPERKKIREKSTPQKKTRVLGEAIDVRRAENEACNVSSYFRLITQRQHVIPDFVR